jgi:protein TonB
MSDTALALHPASRSRGWLGATARVLIVVLAHVAIIGGLAQLDPQLRERVEPLFVDLITPPQPKVEAPPPAPKPKPKPESKPSPRPPQPVVSAKPREIQAPVERAPVSESALSAPPAEPAPVAAGPDSGTGAPGPGTGVGKGDVGIVAPRFDAAYLNNPRPEYPRIARRMGEQGRVLLNVFVSAAGNAEKVEIRTSSGHARLDQAAREAVQRWKFVPARRGDEPVSAWVIVPISFVLES